MEYAFLSRRNPINPDRVLSYCRGHDHPHHKCQYIVVGTEDGIGERIRVVIEPKKVVLKEKKVRVVKTDKDIMDYFGE